MRLDRLTRDLVAEHLSHQKLARILAEGARRKRKPPVFAEQLGEISSTSGRPKASDSWLGSAAVRRTLVEAR